MSLHLLNILLSFLPQHFNSCLTFIVTSWLFIEVAFWAYVRRYLYPRLNAHTTPAQHNLGARGILEMILQQVEMMRDHYNIERFVTAWLGGARLEDVRSGNVKEQMACIIFSKMVPDLSPSELLLIDEGVSFVIEDIARQWHDETLQ